MIFGLQGMLAHLTGLSGTTLLLLLVVLSMVLVFAGRKLVKALAFIMSGLVVGSIGASLVTSYISGTGSIGGVLGAIIGFFVGGFIGLALIYLGIGIGIGYLGYEITVTYVPSEIISIIVGIVFFALGVILANKILSIATSVLGGTLLYEVLTNFGAGFIVSLSLAAWVGLLGMWIQTIESRSQAKKTAPMQTQTA